MPVLLPRWTKPPAIHDHQPRTPTQPLHPLDEKPPVLPVPGKDHHREIPQELRDRVWRRLRIHPGIVPGNLRARATSKNGSAGALRAPSESLMNAQARAERPVNLRQLRLHQMQHMLRHELAGPGCRGTPGRPGARGGSPARCRPRWGKASIGRSVMRSLMNST